MQPPNNQRSKAARILRAVSLLALVVGMVVLVSSYFVAESYSRRSVLAQRMQKDEAGALFDDPVQLIGSPQRIVLPDNSAVVSDPDAQGVVLVDEKILKEKGQYPLQLKTVEFIASMARLGALAAIVVALIVLAWQGIFRRRTITESVSV